MLLPTILLLRPPEQDGARSNYPAESEVEWKATGGKLQRRHLRGERANGSRRGRSRSASSICVPRCYFCVQLERRRSQRGHPLYCTQLPSSAPIPPPWIRARPPVTQRSESPGPTNTFKMSLSLALEPRDSAPRCSQYCAVTRLISRANATLPVTSGREIWAQRGGIQ